MVDFEWYRSFVAIYQSGTVSAAAQVRNMTQPGISQHLAALERALDVSLFQRTPRQMIPTEAGKRLYTEVIGPVEQLERWSVPSTLHNRTAPRDLRLGMPREFFYAYGWDRLFNAPITDHRFQFSFGQTVGLIKGLLENKLDAVIATQRIPDRMLHYQPLLIEQFGLVAAAKVNVPQKLSLIETAQWLEDQPWIAYAADLPILRRYWQEVFHRRPQMTPIIILPDLLMILRAVANGLGLSVLPTYLCDQAVRSGEVQVLWTPEQPPTNQLYLTCRKERLSTIEIQTFFKWMLDHDHHLI
ncbi:MAG: LysR family transcriptional regulator [Anaerolineae bacterium]|jgi:DNA-binding transcriptional LysR family regulator|nr:LysR family transcriptional regulator [Anaerolineae bacterium]